MNTKEIKIEVYQNTGISHLENIFNILQYWSCRYCMYVVNKKWEPKRDAPFYFDEFDGEKTSYILAMKGEHLVFGIRILSREKLGFLPGEEACASDAAFVKQKDIAYEISGFVAGGRIATRGEKKLALRMLYAKAFEVCLTSSFFAFINTAAEEYWKILIGDDWITERLSSPIEYRPETMFSGLRLIKPE